MNTGYRHPDLSIDQQRRFDGVLGTETIERFLHSSHDEFAGRVVVLNYLQRLTALARVEGKHDAGVPVLLFLCTHNAGRSQMPLGFFTHLAGDRATAWSGGTEPADRINPAAVASMAERGIGIADEIVRAADAVVTTGCGDACPVFPGRRYLDWTLDDPDGLDVAAIRPIRDEIERRVRALLEEMDVPTHA